MEVVETVGEAPREGVEVASGGRGVASAISTGRVGTLMADGCLDSFKETIKAPRTMRLAIDAIRSPFKAPSLIEGSLLINQDLLFQVRSSFPQGAAKAN